MDAVAVASLLVIGREIYGFDKHAALGCGDRLNFIDDRRADADIFTLPFVYEIGGDKRNGGDIISLFNAIYHRAELRFKNVGIVALEGIVLALMPEHCDNAVFGIHIKSAVEHISHSLVSGILGLPIAVKERRSSKSRVDYKNLSALTE